MQEAKVGGVVQFGRHGCLLILVIVWVWVGIVSDQVGCLCVARQVLGWPGGLDIWFGMTHGSITQFTVLELLLIVRSRSRQEARISADSWNKRSRISDANGSS